MTAEARQRTPGAVIDRRTVADYLVETLEASGVQRIFGLPGDSLNGLTDALRRHEKLTWLHMRHEEGPRWLRRPLRRRRGSWPSARPAAARATCTW